MNAKQARARVAETFPQPFHRLKFLEFIRNLLNRFDETRAQAWNSSYVKDAFKSHVSRFERLGTYTSPDGDKVDVLIVHLTTESKLERTRTALRNFVADHLKTRDGKDAGLVAFVSPTEQLWRFSYVKMEYAAVDGGAGGIGIETRLTPARRLSYIVGAGESCHTAQSRFLALLQDTENSPTLAQIEDAFSVEAVTKEFFKQYAELFVQFDAALQKLAAKDKKIANEFERKNLRTVDFAKKLMGQIVFLYFLQRKGWLGVPKGEAWGEGPHRFLRQLANGTYGRYENLFNDFLEPLFYETLATDRGHEAWCERFHCRMPFLNGGLFEPLSDYDWRKIDIALPNTLFTNTERNKAGDIGTGILDVFDRYNFTVNEAEPLEKDVAIDPEMLGKVFENLIEENRRRGLGSYYTPREIVHYMCQEALVNYLDTTLSGIGKSISRKDLETFVHLGEEISHYEAVKTRYAIKMPKSIEEHARQIDESLANIRICDPAVGSGAFPVGVMTEIVRARSALTPYFNDVIERTPYQFKRHAIHECLYGVDIDPGAIEIAKLRLWLSLIVDEEDVEHIKPLPNLDYKIVVGNSLLGFPFKSQQTREIERLKTRYFDETDRQKKGELKSEIDQRLSDAFGTSTRSLGYTITFDFALNFSEVFQSQAGFDLVIANPPYVRTKNIPAEFKEVLWKRFETFEKKADLYVCFLEQGIKLLRAGGTLVFITSNGFLRLDSFEGLRRFLLRETRLRKLIDFEEDVFDSAAVKACVTALTRGAVPDGEVLTARPRSHLQLGELQLRAIPQAAFTRSYKLIFDLSSAAETDAIKERMRNQSSALGNDFDISFGLKTGDDKKFLSRQASTKQHKRLLRGENVGRYLIKFGGEFVWYVPERMIAHRKTARPGTPERFQQPKGLVRDTGSGLCCTYDGESYFVKDVLVVTHASKSPELLKKLVAVLNSRLMRFYYETSFPTLHVQRDELASLPIDVRLLQGAATKLAALVDKIIAAKHRSADADVTAAESEIDRIVYSLYELGPQEISTVEAMRN